MFARMAHVQFDAARHTGQRAVEAASASVRSPSVATSPSVCADQRLGIDLEQASGRRVRARHGAVGVEGDHRVGIVVEDRAKALFAGFDLRERFVFSVMSRAEQ